MTRPIILLKNDFLKPIETMRNTLIEIESELIQTNSKVIEKSIFAYLMANFEIMISDILAIHLNSFPEKINLKEFKILKESLINNSSTLKILEVEIEKYVQSLSYKNVQEYLEIFCKIISIQNFGNDLVNELIERKATRNLLLHNNLKLNNIYVEKSGVLKREPDYNGYLKLDKKYIKETIDLIKKISDIIYRELEQKYSKFTKFNVLKELWNYVFLSPILSFDDFWEDSSSGITFKPSVRKVKQLIKNCFSSSETKFLALWISHFNVELANKLFNFNNLNTFTLDNNHREKYMYLLGVIENYPELFKTP